MTESPLGRFPASAGFRAGESGTHSSRTVMLAELRTLLDACPSGAPREAYQQAALTDNALGKKTQATRRQSFQRLSELYSLDPQVPVFRALRFFWDRDRDGRPLLALLCAAARDPLLRLTSEPILRCRPGEEVGSAAFDEALRVTAPDRFRPAIRQGVARRLASSWTQSGHLSGRTRKVRRAPVVTPGAAGYALALGHLQGLDGDLLFTTLWARLLAPPARLRDLAADASRRAWINYRHAGGVTEVRFPDLFGNEEPRRVAT